MVVPLINLSTYFNRKTEGEGETQDSLLLLEFNRQHVAFRVEMVERIFRISWKDTLPSLQLGGDTSPITSIWRQESALVPLIDFEAITTSIGIGTQNATIGLAARTDSVRREEIPIVYADDSALISQMIKDSFIEAGFNNLRGFGDGDALWQYLDELAQNHSAEEIKSRVACVVTDIEMPRMDGLSLTKIIRNNPATADIPVVVYSSIACEDNRKKGVQVGATAQVPKPHYEELVRTVDELLQTAP